MALGVRADAAQVFPTTAGRVLKSLGTLDFRFVEALAVVAVIGASATASDVDSALHRLRPAHPGDARKLLDRLVDSGLLRATSTGYQMRNGHGRAELFAWLRPAALRRIHTAVAREELTDSGERVRRLMATGQQERAHEAAAAAVAKACQEGDFARARELLDLLDEVPAPASSGRGHGLHRTSTGTKVGLLATA
jgi:hypothetical protein